MALPDLIEIVPLSQPMEAEVTVPGSKSITNRALVLAALGEDEITLEGALWSEDTQIMVECLQKLGFHLQVAPDPREECNRQIRVSGRGGRIPRAGTRSDPLDLFVGNAGTVARFLTALVCLGNGVFRLNGIERMQQRPQAPLFRAIRQLGYRIEADDDRLPALVFGEGPHRGTCSVSITESSQFASALFLCAGKAGWLVEVVGENAEESPYVTMTTKLVQAFPHKGGRFQVEPDASSGSYFCAAGFLMSRLRQLKFRGLDESALKVRKSPWMVKVSDWPASGWQVDGAFPNFLPLPKQVSRQRDLGDSIMTAIVLAPFSQHSVRFTDLGRLRLQECERVAALRTELTKCGAEVFEEGDVLCVSPSQLHGAEIETYNDHRIAMCFAILGLQVAGIQIKNPGCVKKTFPDFFRKLAELPPTGLGAPILDVANARRLSVEELFAA
jgi:3-phosphoshikimate 1-carboxyvinyltransferase